MGCINEKADSPQLPKRAEKTEPQPQQQPTKEYPAAVAFQIPVSTKSKPIKGNKLNKPLYIIRQVSNANHELVESPLRPPKPTQEQNTKQEVDAFDPTISKQRNRTKTCKDLSVCEQSNDEKQSNPKTARVIESQALTQQQKMIQRRNKLREANNRRRDSENNSSLSKRYIHDQSEEGSANKKKRKASLDMKALNEHQARFKRAKTLHHQDQLVYQSKSISLNRGDTNAMSELPVQIQAPRLGSRNYQAEINLVIQKEGEQSPNLLELYHGLSAELQDKKQYEGAIAANSKYLKVARKNYGIQSCAYAAGLSNLSSINYSMSHYEKAVQNSMKAKSIRSFSPMEEYMHKARVLNEIGLIELEQNQIKQASHYLEEVKEIHNKVASQLHLNFHDLFAETSISSKNQYYQKSVQSMEVALKICTRLFGENHLQTANHLDDLATSYCDSGQYKECLSCYERCFRIMRVIRQLKHKDFQVHTKHFHYSIQVIKTSESITSQVLSKSISILEDFFPQDQLMEELKSRLQEI